MVPAASDNGQCTYRCERREIAGISVLGEVVLGGGEVPIVCAKTSQNYARSFVGNGNGNFKGNIHSTSFVRDIVVCVQV